MPRFFAALSLMAGATLPDPTSPGQGQRQPPIERLATLLDLNDEQKVAVTKVLQDEHVKMESLRQLAQSSGERSQTLPSRPRSSTMPEPATDSGSDDGPGIPAESLEQVFEPFFRLESSRSRDTGGTGLGLTITRDVVQAHGGTVVLRNIAPRGLEAIVTLPRNSGRAKP